MSPETRTRDDICKWGKSLFERGLSPGSSGNLSARLEDGSFLVTPTNSCLGFLDPANLCKLGPDGQYISGGKPTKEAAFHLAYYNVRPQAMGVVHLHSRAATALSCLKDINRDNVITPITPYILMRLGQVPVLDYTPPGSAKTADLITAHGAYHAAVLLKNHGPIVTGTSFEAAVFAAEELEESCALQLLTGTHTVDPLTPEQITELKQLFPVR